MRKAEKASKDIANYRLPIADWLGVAGVDNWQSEIGNRQCL
jgi:hypothetical protein